ncbi:hypothetical protein CBL_13646 [Carabus blaptoides fortunei]
MAGKAQCGFSPECRNLEILPPIYVMASAISMIEDLTEQNKLFCNVEHCICNVTFTKACNWRDMYKVSNRSSICLSMSVFSQRDEDPKQNDGGSARFRLPAIHNDCLAQSGQSVV